MKSFLKILLLFFLVEPTFLRDIHAANNNQQNDTITRQHILSIGIASFPTNYYNFNTKTIRTKEIEYLAGYTFLRNRLALYGSLIYGQTSLGSKVIRTVIGLNNNLISKNFRFKFFYGGGIFEQYTKSAGDITFEDYGKGRYNRLGIGINAGFEYEIIKKKLSVSVEIFPGYSYVIEKKTTDFLFVKTGSISLNWKLN